MGGLADLLIAEKADIPSILASDYPLETYKGISVDGLDPLAIAALHAELSGQGFEALLEQYHPVGSASPEGPWLIQFPNDMVTRMAEFSPPDYHAIADRWIETAQVLEAGWSREQTEQYVGQVVYLAQNAAYDGKEIFLFMYN